MQAPANAPTVPKSDHKPTNGGRWTVTPPLGDANDPKETFTPKEQGGIANLVGYLEESHRKIKALTDLAQQLNAEVGTLSATVIDLNTRLMQLEGDEYEDNDDGL